ncbi:hypothetical protein [Sphingomonas fennica]|uniref:Lipoprotein n=1 Tax=Edaphosphingomonas fennica TaxID=114404 RepID=A0A2T4I1W6_9SPHN|nr:hypothetical protein [Sphingomonas fennica]PTD22924.1 hypothetical protein CV103_08845 [Sphingomonas fennica]
MAGFPLSFRAALTAIALLAVAGCVAPEAPPPPPPPPAPAPPPPPSPLAWEDAPLTPGDWRYDRGTARFGVAGQPAELVLACQADRTILLSRAAPAGSTANGIDVTTSYGKRRLPATPAAQGLTARLAASDGLLDWMAFSRGRFRIDTEGLPALTIPAWAEVARVVEDCRK